jgi:DNA-directed RNA polymerase subunit E'/Rpb7
MDTQKKKRIMKKKDTVRADVIYSRCTITRPVQLNMKQVGKTLKSSLERKVKAELEGKCIVEGYVKKDSVKVVSFSNGEVKGELIQFQTIVDCLVCFPVDGMLVQCSAKNITKAGIRAEIQGESVSPIVCFISRDHHINSSQFAAVSENDPILVRIIGQRFELNDNFISAIGELVVDKEKQNTNKGTRRRQTEVAAKD